MKLGSRINSSTYWDNFIDRKIPSNKTKYEESTRHVIFLKLILGGFPIEIKNKIIYLMICCYLIFIRLNYDNNKK